MPLFRIYNQSVSQIKPVNFSKERDLQTLFEKNLDTLLGIRFIASEFTTGDRQRGRIDTLGLDQDGTPVIIEYKRSSKDNIINQGLFYLDWLIDHKGDFALAAQKKLGKDVYIDWSHPRLLLVAESFSVYDQYAVNRIAENIELWTFQLYSDGLLLLNAFYIEQNPSKTGNKTKRTKSGETMLKDVEPTEEIHIKDHLVGKNEEIVGLFNAFREAVFKMDDSHSIIEKAVKHYIAYKHGKNFCEIWVQSNRLKIWLDISKQELEDPFNLSRDVSEIGHSGTGNIEITLNSQDDLEKIMHLVTQAYQLTI